MLVLKVRKDSSGDWQITGLGRGKTVELYLGDNPDSEEMLGALYDEWQGSEELGKANEDHGGDGLLFDTPVGSYATVSYVVMSIENLVGSANKLYATNQKMIEGVMEMVMSEAGFDKSTLKEIYAKHGTKFADWPKQIVTKYWAAWEKAQNAQQKMRGV